MTDSTNPESLTKEDIQFVSSVGTVFTVKPQRNSSSAIIKYYGTMDANETIQDEPLICHFDKINETDNIDELNDISESNNLADADKMDKNNKLNKLNKSKKSNKSNGSDLNGETINKYIYNISETVYARFYKSMIAGNYLMMNKALPVIHCSILYEDKLVKGFLLNICIEFQITTKVKSEKELINNKLDGIYQIVIRKDEKEDAKCIELEIFPTEKIIIETLKTIIQTDEMKSVIKDMLEKRRLERIEKYGSFDDIEIPKPRYNFNKLVQQYSQTHKTK
jgi:hypothetical protein